MKVEYMIDSLFLKLNKIYKLIDFIFIVSYYLIHE